MTLDKSFFTKSMDLTAEDIVPVKNEANDDDQIDTLFEEDKMPAWKVVLIIVLITIVLGLLAYIILRFV